MSFCLPFRKDLANDYLFVLGSPEIPWYDKDYKKSARLILKVREMQKPVYRHNSLPCIDSFSSGTCNQKVGRLLNVS